MPAKGNFRPFSAPDQAAIHAQPALPQRQKRPVTGWPANDSLNGRFTLLPLRLSFHRKRHGRLSARHRQIHFGKDLGIEQCAVQSTFAIIYLITRTQRIKAVTLAGEHFPRQRRYR